jgi:hypothetical protein
MNTNQEPSSALAVTPRSASDLIAWLTKEHEGYYDLGPIIAPHRQIITLIESQEAEVKRLQTELDRAYRQVTVIEDFLWERKYCTELYISPLGTNGGEAWQVELNWGDGTEAFQGDSVAQALSKAMVAAMLRRPNIADDRRAPTHP